MSDSNKDWTTVTNNKQKIKQEEPIKFDPIPSRQKQALEQAQKQKTLELLLKQQNQQRKNNNSCQDWETKIITKTQPKSNPTVLVPYKEKKVSAIKVNESGDIVQTKKISSQMAKEIVNARIAKKLSQVQLAHNSNVDIKIINEIEKGGCLYDANIFNKICKTLCINVERNCDLVQTN